MEDQIIVVTMDYIPRKEIVRIIGVVHGNVVWARGGPGGGKFFATNVEFPNFTEILGNTKQTAFDRMIHQAHELGANAIVAVKYDTSSSSPSIHETHVYGTAVVVEPI